VPEPLDSNRSAPVTQKLMAHEREALQYLAIATRARAEIAPFLREAAQGKDLEKIALAAQLCKRLGDSGAARHFLKIAEKRFVRDGWRELHYVGYLKAVAEVNSPAAAEKLVKAQIYPELLKKHGTYYLKELGECAREAGLSSVCVELGSLIVSRAHAEQSAFGRAYDLSRAARLGNQAAFVELGVLFPRLIQEAALRDVNMRSYYAAVLAERPHEIYTRATVAQLNKALVALYVLQQATNDACGARPEGAPLKPFLFSDRHILNTMRTCVEYSDRAEADECAQQCFKLHEHSPGYEMIGVLGAYCRAALDTDQPDLAMKYNEQTVKALMALHSNLDSHPKPHPQQIPIVNPSTPFAVLPCAASLEGPLAKCGGMIESLKEELIKGERGHPVSTARRLIEALDEVHRDLGVVPPTSSRARNPTRIINERLKGISLALGGTPFELTVASDWYNAALTFVRCDRLAEATWAYENYWRLMSFAEACDDIVPGPQALCAAYRAKGHYEEALKVAQDFDKGDAFLCGLGSPRALVQNCESAAERGDLRLAEQYLGKARALFAAQKRGNGFGELVRKRELARAEACVHHVRSQGKPEELLTQALNCAKQLVAEGKLDSIQEEVVRSTLARFGSAEEMLAMVTAAPPKDRQMLEIKLLTDAVLCYGRALAETPQLLNAKVKEFLPFVAGEGRRRMQSSDLTRFFSAITNISTEEVKAACLQFAAEQLRKGTFDASASEKEFARALIDAVARFKDNRAYGLLRDSAARAGVDPDIRLRCLEALAANTSLLGDRTKAYLRQGGSTPVAAPAKSTKAIYLESLKRAAVLAVLLREGLVLSDDVLTLILEGGQITEVTRAKTNVRQINDSWTKIESPPHSEALFKELVRDPQKLIAFFVHKVLKVQRPFKERARPFEDFIVVVKVAEATLAVDQAKQKTLKTGAELAAPFYLKELVQAAVDNPVEAPYLFSRG
jgi:hypothetical protein